MARTRDAARAARSARRNEKRKAKNAAARKAAVPEDEPVREYARHITQLELLRKRGNISERQFHAGDRFYRDWRVSGSEPRLVPAYDREIGLGGDNFSLHQIQARQRFEGAMRALGWRCRDIVVHVCLLDGKIVEYGDLVSAYRSGKMTDQQVAEEWRERLTKADAMDRLRDGLNYLSMWYGSERRIEYVDKLDSTIVVTC